MVLGFIVALAAVNIMGMDPTDASCSAGPWLLALGFSAGFGSLFGKTYRLHRIMNNRQMRAVRIPDMKILQVIACCCCFATAAALPLLCCCSAAAAAAATNDQLYCTSFFSTSSGWC